MDSMNQSGAPQTSGSASPMGTMGSEKKEGGVGALVGTIIIIVLLVVAGAYVWMNQPSGSGPDAEILNAPDATLDSLNQQSTSDELNAIEQDVNNTNLNNLNSDLNSAQGEINSVQ